MARPTPTDVDALRRVHPFIHPLNLEDVLSVIERPKIDDDPDYLFVVMQFPQWDAKNRLSRPAEVNFIVGKGFVVTVHDGVLKPLVQLFQTCQRDAAECQKLLGKSPGHAFYTMVDRLVDYIFPILSRVDVNIREIEEKIFTAEGFDLIRDIALVRRDIIALRRIIRQQVPILENLERVERHIIQEDLDEYFGDIVDHMHRARDIIDEDSEIISSLSETADMLLSHRLNSVIRILTVFSVLVLPLTFISSVYGMNIDLPLAEHPDAFLIINGLMILLAVVMLVYFRHRKWL